MDLLAEVLGGLGLHCVAGVRQTNGCHASESHPMHTLCRWTAAAAEPRAGCAICGMSTAWGGRNRTARPWSVIVTMRVDRKAASAVSQRVHAMSLYLPPAEGGRVGVEGVVSLNHRCGDSRSE